MAASRATSWLLCVDAGLSCARRKAGANERRKLSSATAVSRRLPSDPALAGVRLIPSSQSCTSGDRPVSLFARPDSFCLIWLSSLTACLRRCIKRSALCPPRARKTIPATILSTMGVRASVNSLGYLVCDHHLLSGSRNSYISGSSMRVRRTAKSSSNNRTDAPAASGRREGTLSRGPRGTRVRANSESNRPARADRFKR